MNHPLPEPREFNEAMFMHYAARVERNHFRSDAERNFCIQQMDIYFNMLQEVYPWSHFLADSNLTDILVPINTIKQ